MAYDLIKISGLPLVTPDNGQDIVVGVGDYAKRINYGDVKADMVGTSPTYTTDTEPYLMRRTAHTGVVGKCALNRLVGGSLGWNQIIPTTASGRTSDGVTFTNNGDGSWTLTGTPALDNVFTNLWYQAGVNNFITGHVYYCSKGNNSSYTIGTLVYGLTSTGVYTTLQDRIYKCDSTKTAQGYVRIQLLNLRNTNIGTVVTKPIMVDLTQMLGADVAEYLNTLETGTTGAGVAKLKEWGFFTDNSYYPYNTGEIKSVQATAHVTKDADDNVIGNYPLGSDTLRGIPQLVSNKLAFDGDEKYPDGTIKRKYGVANIDDLTFTYDSTNKWLMGSSALPNAISSTTAMPNSMTDMPYDAVAANTLNVNTKAWTLYTGKVVVKDSSLTEAQLRAAISGKHIVYPLSTETTESSTSFQKIQTIDADGTESFTTSSPVPVGHETQTPDNILAALEWLGE